jgi:hypothetical protein
MGLHPSGWSGIEYNSLFCQRRIFRTIDAGRRSLAKNEKKTHARTHISDMIDYKGNDFCLFIQAAA